MKEIQKTETNLKAASEVLAVLRGDEDARLPCDPIVTFDGITLRWTSAIHPLDPGEEVIADDLDSFGCGWGDKDVVPGDVIDFLNDCE